MGERGLNDPNAAINAHFVSRSGFVLRAVADRSGRIIESNTAFESLFGTGGDLAEIAEIAGGLTWAGRLAEPNPSVLTLTSKTTSGALVAQLYPDGDRVHLLGIQADPDQLLSRVSTDFASLSFTARQERRRLTDRAELSGHEAMTDPLTLLPNRRHLEERLDEFGPNGIVSAAMVDIDRFKAINDRFGHAAGDTVLATVAATLRSACRPDDMTARYGGEEFVIVLPGTPIAHATGIAERVREAIEQTPSLPDGGSVTVSIGVAERRAGEALHEALDRSDQALFRAKHGGRNRVVADDDPKTLSSR